MPLVTIEWTPGRDQDQRDAIAKRVVDAVSEIGNIGPESIWVKFHEVSSDVWYVGENSIAERARRRKAADSDTRLK